MINILSQISEFSIKRTILEGDTQDIVNLVESEDGKRIEFRHVDRYRRERDYRVTVTSEKKSFKKFIQLVKFLIEKKSLSYQAKDVLDGVSYDIALGLGESVYESFLFCPEYSKDMLIKECGALLEEFYTEVEKKN